MGKRITLNDAEINVLVQCMNEQKDKGLSYINKQIGEAFLDELVAKLLKGRTGDVTIRGIYTGQVKKEAKS